MRKSWPRPAGPQGRSRAAAARQRAQPISRPLAPQVGHQEPRHRHYRPQHDRHRPNWSRTSPSWRSRSPIADQKILTATLGRRSVLISGRMCGSASGQCPRVLPVADMVRFVMYADGYGQFPLGRENSSACPPKHQAVKCGQCPTCVVKWRPRPERGRAHDARPGIVRVVPDITASLW